VKLEPEHQAGAKNVRKPAMRLILALIDVI
jgi:hypothetical protein